MKTSTDIPTIYSRLRDAFQVDWDDGIIICVGDTAHCKFHIPTDKLYHEAIHAKQQEKIGINLWWEMYIGDPSFRLKEELEAIKAELSFWKKLIKDRNDLFRIKVDLAHSLSSSMYGNIISPEEALKLL